MDKVSFWLRVVLLIGLIYSVFFGDVFQALKVFLVIVPLFLFSIELELSSNKTTINISFKNKE